MTEFEKDLQNEGENTNQSINENASQSENISPNENANQIANENLANESEKIYKPKPEYATMRKGFKGFWWNIVNYAMLSPTDKKKVTKRLIVRTIETIAIIVICIFGISTAMSYITSDEMNASSFASNWNRMAKSEDNITHGVKISAKRGWFDYTLKNGAKLEGHIVQSGILSKKELVRVTYAFENIKEIDLQDLLNDYIDLFDGIKNKSEAVNQLLKEKESFIESGITGVVCSDDKVEFRYIYSEKFIENDITGLSFGYSFDEALARFNDEYAKAINSSYTYKSYPKDEEFIDCAYTLIYDALKSPSTASLVSSEVFEKDKYGRAVVLLTVDAENSFGAYIRSNYCVVIQGINYDDTFEYNRINYCQEYTSATKDIVIESLKAINGFGKERSGGKDIYEASDFSKSTVNDYIKYANDEIIYFIDQKTNTIFAAEYLLPADDDIDAMKKVASITVKSVTSATLPTFDFSSDKTQVKYENGVLYYLSNNRVGAITISKDVYAKVEEELLSSTNLNTESIYKLTIQNITIDNDSDTENKIDPPSTDEIIDTDTEIKDDKAESTTEAATWNDQFIGSWISGDGTYRIDIKEIDDSFHIKGSFILTAEGFYSVTFDIDTPIDQDGNYYQQISDGYDIGIIQFYFISQNQIMLTLTGDDPISVTLNHTDNTKKDDTTPPSQELSGAKYDTIKSLFDKSAKELYNGSSLPDPIGTEGGSKIYEAPNYENTYYYFPLQGEYDELYLYAINASISFLFDGKDSVALSELKEEFGGNLQTEYSDYIGGYVAYAEYNEFRFDFGEYIDEENAYFTTVLIQKIN